MARSLHVLDIYEKEDFPLAQFSSVKEVRLTLMPLRALRLGIRLIFSLAFLAADAKVVLCFSLGFVLLECGHSPLFPCRVSGHVGER